MHIFPLLSSPFPYFSRLFRPSVLPSFLLCQSHNEFEVLGTPVFFYAPICPQCVGDQNAAVNAPLFLPPSPLGLPFGRSPLLGSNCGDATWRFAQIFA